MRINEIAFAAYPVADLERARKFYEGVLGLKTTAEYVGEEGAWIEYDIGPGTLALGHGMEGWDPSTNGGVVGLEVEDYDAAVAAVRKAGAPIVFEETLSTCRMTIITDPEGNALIIHKRNA